MGSLGRCLRIPRAVHNLLGAVNKQTDNWVWKEGIVLQALATCGLYSKIMCPRFLPQHHYDLEVVIRLVITSLPAQHRISVSLFLSSWLL